MSKYEAKSLYILRESLGEEQGGLENFYLLEQYVCKKLEWKLVYPTTNIFFSEFLHALGNEYCNVDISEISQCIVNKYTDILSYRPSTIAAATIKVTYSLLYPSDHETKIDNFLKAWFSSEQIVVFSYNIKDLINAMVKKVGPEISEEFNSHPKGSLMTSPSSESLTKSNS